MLKDYFVLPFDELCSQALAINQHKTPIRASPTLVDTTCTNMPPCRHCKWIYFKSCGLQTNRRRNIEETLLWIKHMEAHGIQQALDKDEFSELTAAKSDQVFVCPTGVFFWDSGVQKILMLMWMASTMYPDYFPDLDMKAELKYFYNEFFNYDLTDQQAGMILAHKDPS